MNDLNPVGEGIPSGINQEHITSGQQSPLDKARVRSAELRAAGLLVRGPVLNPIERAKLKPTSLRLAIRAKCFECVGSGADPSWQDSVRHCSASLCPLLPVRPYQVAEDDDPPLAE